jgi:ABC-2 type transport system ATP-binding protein
MRKKIGLIVSLLSGARLLLLDEPFTGVDEESAEVIRHILRRFASSGGTVVLSSSDMSSVERSCDYATIIANGRTTVSGEVDELLAG